MKYVDEFRNLEIAKKLAKEIARLTGGEYRIMEVCGTHTQTIFRYGLSHLLPKEIKFLSGPGCPVCVSPTDFMDKAIYYSRQKDFIITTFGDMMRVPGSASSLEKEKARGRDIRVVYSSLDALQLAVKNPYKKIVFLGVGFETTAPTVAASIIEAKKKGIDNFYVLSGHKTMPQALRALVSGKKLKIDAFILPAHVSTIIGAGPYSFIPDEFGIDCVIAGFEPLDVLQGVLMLVKGRGNKTGQRPVKIQYARVVKKNGNRQAMKVIDEVFEAGGAQWRGLGNIPGSGLGIKKKYKAFDIECHRKAVVGKVKENTSCICGAVLKGLNTPADCRLFAKLCKPENPVGPCMVSQEGTCATYYKYGVGR